MDIENLRALTKKLRIKSGMMKMGERIAWGSDTELMDEAEAGILALIEENDRLRAMCLQAADIFDANDFGHDLRFEIRDAALARRLQHEDAK